MESISNFVDKLKAFQDRKGKEESENLKMSAPKSEVIC
jgi:hypothetical protein